MSMIRPLQPDDLDLVRDSFWRSVQATCPAAEGVGRAVLVELLDRALAGSWRIAVLCPDEDTSDEVGGWILYRSPTTIGWLAVKPRYRHLCFARALLDHVGVKPGRVVVPLVPRGGYDLAARFGLQLVVRPYSLLA